MKMSVDYFLENHIVSKVPFEREGSQAFLMAVKLADYDKINKILNRNSLFVYDFDYLY